MWYSCHNYNMVTLRHFLPSLPCVAPRTNPVTAPTLNHVRPVPIRSRAILVPVNGCPVGWVG